MGMGNKSVHGKFLIMARHHRAEREHWLGRPPPFGRFSSWKCCCRPICYVVKLEAFKPLTGMAVIMSCQCQ